jgi:tetratricopeptide (TPR) repeat protein
VKICLAFAILMVGTTVAAAQDRMAESLRKGVVEEETKHNLNAAIQDYQTVLAQFDEARQTAATALFRIAECYRKQGKDDQAVAAYKRVAQEFADQGKLAEPSRSILANTYHAATADAPSNASKEQARQAYRNTLVEELSLIEKRLQQVQRTVSLGVVGQDALANVKSELLQAQRQLYAFDAGIPQGQPVPAKK